VTLRLPPPLERELPVKRVREGVRLLHGAAVVAEARPLDGLELDVPPPVSIEAARAAGEATPLVEGHPFPTCFGCGPDHDQGLHCLAGPVAGRDDDVWAVDWTPDEVSAAIVWAALDCPSSAPIAIPGAAHVLGRMAVRIDRLPEAGAPHAVISWPLRVDGRKKHAASALLDADGAVLAVARATWIELLQR
jgi:hypothetical protein